MGSGAADRWCRGSKGPPPPLRRTRRCRRVTLASLRMPPKYPFTPHFSMRSRPSATVRACFGRPALAHFFVRGTNATADHRFSISPAGDFLCFADRGAGEFCVENASGETDRLAAPAGGSATFTAGAPSCSAVSGGSGSLKEPVFEPWTQRTQTSTSPGRSRGPTTSFLVEVRLPSDMK